MEDRQAIVEHLNSDKPAIIVIVESWLHFNIKNEFPDMKCTVGGSSDAPVSAHFIERNTLGFVRSSSISRSQLRYASRRSRS